MKMTRAKVKQLRADIDAALAAVEKKHGVEFDLGRITFTDTDFRGKLTCKSADPNADRKIFERDALRVGLKKTAYGKTFTHVGRDYRVSGVNTRAKKYPVKVVDVASGGNYKMSVEALPRDLRW
jgi:hypothetical protein